MADFEKMYYRLAERVADAVEVLMTAQVGGALSILVAAQLDCEGMLVGEGE